MSKIHLLIASVAATVILIGITTLTASAGVVTFSDGNFNDADWTPSLMYETGNGGSLDSQTYQATGGRSGSYRLIQQTVNVHNGVNPSCYWEFYQYGNGTTTGVFDPATQGAIQSVDFSQWWNITSRGTPDGYAVGVVLQQGGNQYLSLTDSVPESGWTQKAHTGLTASSFRTMLDANAHPDFSATGAPIIAGYYAGNSTTATTGPFTDVGGIDDWTISFYTVPEPATLTLLALSALALVGRRRSRSR